MLGPQVFQVLTEFRFEVGSAVANSNALKSAVEGVSSAADQALFNFQKLSTGIVATMGLGSGSLLGIFGAAIQSSDKFGQSQRAFANIMSSNMQHLTGHVANFQERMETSEAIMGNINKLASEFSLPSEDLLNMSKLLSATLVPKGLAGNNFGTAIDISRSFLKAAPTLGVDPGLAQGQLLDMIQGRANFGDTLFQRMSNETTALKPYGAQHGPQKFNQLDAAHRVELVQKALKQFSSDMDVLKGNAYSLSGEMRRLTEAIKGPFSILRGLGDVMLIPILKVLHEFNEGLRTTGVQTVKNLSNLIKGFISDPENLLINVMQARKLKQDFGAAGGVLSTVGMVTGVGHAIKWLGGSALFAHPLVGLLAGSVMVLGEVLKRTDMDRFAKVAGVGAGLVAVGGALAYFGWLIPVLSFALNAIFLPITLLTGLFQLLARSKSIAQVEDAKAMIALAPELTGAMFKLKTVFGILLQPFADAFDAVARFISPVFRMSYYMNMLVWLMDKAATVTMLFQAGFQGLIFGILEAVNQFESFFTGGGFDFNAIADAFNAGVDEMITRTLNAINSGVGPVVQQTTNIGKVEIRNDFKENAEPDRIAFTLKDQLLKAAQNPSQAGGRSLGGAFATR